jgi:hypothetical protein
MPAGLKRVIPAAAVALLALAWPAAALAGGCHASACKVYTESGGSADGGHQSNTGGDGLTQKPLKIPSKTSQLLAHAGKDRKLFSKLVSNPAYGTQRGLDKTSLGSVASPSALGAAFDLGAGPIALLAILLASALGLAVHQGLRGRRRRRAVP